MREKKLLKSNRQFSTGLGASVGAVLQDRSIFRGCARKKLVIQLRGLWKRKRMGRHQERNRHRGAEERQEQMDVDAGHAGCLHWRSLQQKAWRSGSSGWHFSCVGSNHSQCGGLLLPPAARSQSWSAGQDAPASSTGAGGLAPRMGMKRDSS